MADRKLIEEYKLSEAVNRFKQINEYTFITSAPLTEEGDDDTNSNPQQTDNDGSNTMAQGQPMDGNQTQPALDNNGTQPSPQQSTMDATMPQDQNQDTQSSMPPVDNSADAIPPVSPQMDNNMPTDDGIGTDEMQPDDEVIDVDDLTDSQEETEEKVDGVNHQLLRLLKVVSKYNDAIDKQNQEIEALKKEFERRNPTEEEQLNIRSQAGYPYSEKPKEYWEKKVKDNPNYDVMFDNDVPTDKEQEKFEIKDSDLNGINYKDISDSFDDDMKLSDFLNF